MPEWDHDLPSAQNWTEGKWEGYVLRHHGNTWREVAALTKRDVGTLTTWSTGLKKRYGPDFQSRAVRSPEAVRNIPGYQLSHNSVAEQLDHLSGEMRDLIRSAMDVLSRGLKERLEAEDRMDMEDMVKLTRVIDYLRKNHDALRGAVAGNSATSTSGQTVNNYVFQKLDETRVGEASGEIDSFSALLDVYRRGGSPGDD